MPRPVGDDSTGWWSIRIRTAGGKRQKYMLMKQPGWKPGRSLPKKPPPEADVLARKYQDMAVRIRHGVDVSAVRADDLKAFLDEYRTHHAADHRPNSVRILAQAAKHFLKFCGGRGVATVQAVTVALCEEYMRARRKAGAARATVHVEKGSLSPAWNRAVRGRSLAENPWRLAQVPGKALAAEPGFWGADELDRLINAAEGWVKDLIVVAANTGGRVTAILTLRWQDVKLERNVVRFGVKTEPYEVPLSPRAREVFERILWRSKGDLVFPGRNPDRPRVGSVAYVAIRKAVRKAGIPEKGRYNHILRHTFASHAVMRGVPLATVSKWLGHKSIQMTMRYAHLAQEESQRRMEGFSLGPDPYPEPLAGPDSGAIPPPPSG